MSTSAAEQFVSRYSDCQPHGFRKIARHLALSGLAGFYNRTGLALGMLNTNRVQFIHMHFVFHDQIPDFRGMLALLSRHHQFIGYSEAVRRILNDEVDAPYVAVSFDDGIKNCLEIVPLLKEYGIHACFFICPSLVGETNVERVLRFCAEIQSPAVELMSWRDVNGLLDQGHEIGSHTLSHVNLAKVSDTQAQDEICGSFDYLVKKIGGTNHFAWPFGRFGHFTRSSAKFVFDAGFQSCASAERGCHVGSGLSNAELCIRRDHLVASWPHSHLAYFLAKNARYMSPNGNQWPRELEPAAISG